MSRISIHVEQAVRGHHGSLFTYEGTVGGDQFEDIEFSFGASGDFLARPAHEIAERDSQIREVIEETLAAGGSIALNGKTVNHDAYDELAATSSGWKTP